MDWEQVGGGTRRRSDPAAARGSGLPDFAVSGHPGFDTARFWVREHMHETCKPHVLFVRGYGILGGLRSVGAVLRWRSSPACAHSRVAGLDLDTKGPVCVRKAKT